MVNITTAGVHRFSKFKKPLQILGARRVTWSKVHTEDPQILGATVQNLVITATGVRDLCTSELRIATALRITGWEALGYFLSDIRTKCLSDTIHCTKYDCVTKTCTGLAAVSNLELITLPAILLDVWRNCSDGIILKLFLFIPQINTGILHRGKPWQPPSELMSTSYSWLCSHFIRFYITPAFEILTEELTRINEYSTGMALV
jgi:hypothetical protein